MGQIDRSNKGMDEIERALGSGRVVRAPPPGQDLGDGRAFGGVRISGTVSPKSMDDVVTVVRIASAQGISLYPISTGNNWGYGGASPVMQGCLLVDLSGMRKIRDFDSQSGVVTVEPGVTQDDLAAFLDRNGHPFLVPVSGAGPHCSLLGNALERGYGVTPTADHFAAVTAIEAVLPDASIYRSALSSVGTPELDKLFKWGIGPYVDGLFTQCGMGVVTAMSIALARRPEGVFAFLFGLKTDRHLEPAVAAVSRILARLPGLVGAVNLMNRHRVLAMAEPFPGAEVPAGELIPDDLLASLASRHQILPWTGFGTLYGTRATAAAAKAEIRRELRGVASRLIFVSPAQARRLAALGRWLPSALRARVGRSLEMLASSLDLVAGRPNETALPLAYWKGGRVPPDGTPMNPGRDGCGLAWYAPLVPMRPEAVRRYVDMTMETMRAHRMEPLITLTSLSERCFDSSVPLLFDPAQDSQRDRARACLDRLLEQGRAQGFVPYRVGTHSMNWLMGLAPEYWALVGRLKAAIDPNGIIAPGRYAPPPNGRA